MRDPSKFVLLNVADSCSLWNLLASAFLFSTARGSAVSLCSTTFVQYECVHKPGPAKPEREELKRRLAKAVADGHVSFHSIDLEDLQDVEILENRKKLSKGELSSIVFARKTSQAFLSDDKNARTLAATMIPPEQVQSVSQLIGWLCFHGKIHDVDKDQIVADLLAVNRNLQPHIDNDFNGALMARLVRDASGSTSTT